MVTSSPKPPVLSVRSVWPSFARASLEGLDDHGDGDDNDDGTAEDDDDGNDDD